MEYYIGCLFSADACFRRARAPHVRSSWPEKKGESRTGEVQHRVKRGAKWQPYGASGDESHVLS